MVPLPFCGSYSDFTEVAASGVAFPYSKLERRLVVMVRIEEQYKSGALPQLSFIHVEWG